MINIAANKHARLYTTQMKMSELIESDYKLILLFSRFNMNLGVGEESVATQCQKQGVSESLFIMICNIYSFAQYHPDNEEVAQIDVKQLLSYLSKSHLYYIDARINPIEEQLNMLINDYPDTYKVVIKKFFSEYKSEVINHFSYEEEIVFPYVNELLTKGYKKSGYNIETFEHNHSNIDDKLSDLKNILIKYLPATNKAEQTELLFQIFSLEEDLSRHTFIENVVLIPIVRQMENNNDDR